MPTATLTETATATATETPTASAKETATATETPTETPTATLTASATDLPLETATATASPADLPTLTETASATASPDFGTPTASATATSTTTATATSAFSLLFYDNFNSNNLATWLLGSDWIAAPIEFGALLARDSVTATQFIQSDFFNVIAEMRFNLTAGAASLSIRQSAAGNYTASIDTSGQLQVIRAGTLVQTSPINTVSDGNWHLLRLSAIDNVIQVWVDGQEAITVQDDAPLPPGGVTLGDIHTEPNRFAVDEFSIYVPTEDLSTYSSNLSNLILQRFQSSSESAALLVMPQVIEGGLIAYKTNEFTSWGFGIYDLAASSRQPVTATTTNSYVEYEPSLWSDGSKLTYIQQIATSGFSEELYTLDPISGTPSRLTNDGFFQGEPVWSPDGTKIAFVRSQPTGGNNRDVFVLNLNAPGTPPVQITNTGSGASPSWSPDGTKIVYSAVFSTGNTELWVINADGSSVPQRLTTNGIHDRYPAWSPDGTKIAYISLNDVHVMNITYDASGNVILGTVQRLTNDSYEDYQPAWSPNSLEIAYSTFRSNQYDIYVVRANGSAPTEPLIAHPSYSESDPSWVSGQTTCSAAGQSFSAQQDCPPTFHFTNIDFNDTHMPLKSLIFWAIFHETSEDRYYSGLDVPIGDSFLRPNGGNRDLATIELTNFLVNDPYTVTARCNPSDANFDYFNSNQATDEQVNNIENRWNNRNVYYILHCEDHRYIESHTIINGFINYERRVSHDASNSDSLMGAVYGYLFENFAGSFGSGASGSRNNTLWSDFVPCGQSGFLGTYPQTFIAVSGTSYSFSDYYTLSDQIEVIIGLQKEKNRIESLISSIERGTPVPPSTGDLESLRLQQQQLENQLNNLPTRRQLEALAVRWLDGYLNCKLNINASASVNPYLNERLQMSYPRIMSQIERAVANFYAMLPDPTNAAFNLRAANVLPTDSPNAVPLLWCAGCYEGKNINDVINQDLADDYYSDANVSAYRNCITLQNILDYSQISYLQYQHIDQLRDCVGLSYSTVLQPVLWLDIGGGSTGNPDFTGYRWVTIAYGQTNSNYNPIHGNRYDVDICSYQHILNCN